MAYPSRIYATVWFIIACEYVLLVYIKSRHNKQEKPTKRFVFCDGTKSRIVYIDMVPESVFYHYDRYIGYGVIDQNNSSIYFDLNY